MQLPSLLSSTTQKILELYKYGNADDTTAGGDLTFLKAWWDCVFETGPEYCYHPSVSKTWLIVKETNFEEATTLFKGTGVSITVEAKRHLGAATSDDTVAESHVHIQLT